MKIQLPIVFALLTALCWGLYGPTLGKSRLADPTQSPFKPYVFIGVAYLVLAIVGGLIGMGIKGDSFQFLGPSTKGTLFAFAAGTLGALGAFSLTMAMSTGGAKQPHTVMPFVFGGAVTIAALYPVIASWGGISTKPMLWVGIAGMIVSAVIVAYNMPHAAPHKKSASVHAPSTAGDPAAHAAESSS